MELTFETPGIHETELRKQFGQFDVPEGTPPWPGPVCIMLFVNRSGSSLVGEYIRATEHFTGFGEPLNYKLVLDRRERHGFASFADYFTWLQGNVFRPGTTFGMKASCDQVMMLLRCGAIPRLFPDVRWVMIQRNDVLSQAVSLSIAHQTKRWHSYVSGESTEPQYDYEAIKAHVRQITNSYAAMNMLTSLLGVTPYRISYETFIEDPMQGTRDLAAFLGADEVTIDTSELRMQRQRDSRNEEFRERFVADYLRAQSVHSGAG